MVKNGLFLMIFKPFIPYGLDIFEGCAMLSGSLNGTNCSFNIS